jgi:hypothetical protein
LPCVQANRRNQSGLITLFAHEIQKRKWQVVPVFSEHPGRNLTRILEFLRTTRPSRQV